MKRLPYRDMLSLMAVYLSRTNRIISGKETTCVLDTKAKDTDPPAWSDGTDVFFNVGSSPDVTTRDGRAVFFGLNDHELAHLLFTPRDPVFIAGIRFYQAAFNILEDQRIESLISHLYPSMSAFLTAAYGKYIMKPHGDLWAFTYGRLYLPDKVRRWALARYTGRSMNDVNRGKEIIRKYCSLDLLNPMNHRAAQMLVVEFHNLLGLQKEQHDLDHCASRMNPDTKSDQKRTEEQKQDTEKALEANREKFEEEAGEGAEGTGSGKESGEEGEGGEGEEQEANDGSSGAGGRAAGSGAGELEDSVPTQQEALEAINEVLLTEDVQRAIGQLEKFINGDAPIYSSLKERYTPREVETWARSIVSQSLQTIKRVEDEVDSGWEHMKTSGRLNPLRAARLGPFEPEVFNQWNPGNDPDSSFEICVLLDRSGSMSGSTESLSQATWAMKRMGDLIDASTSVWAYDNVPSIIYMNTDKADPNLAPYVGARGGTEPSAALRDAYFTLTRSKRRRKLLIVMTDGDWSPMTSRHAWGRDWFKTNEDVIKALGDLGVMTVTVLYGSSFYGNAHGAKYSRRVMDLGKEMPIVMREMVDLMLREKK